MQAKAIVLGSGANKADAVHAALRGPVTPHVPASVLQLHPFVTFVVDQGRRQIVDLGQRGVGKSERMKWLIPVCE